MHLIIKNSQKKSVLFYLLHILERKKRGLEQKILYIFAKWSPKAVPMVLAVRTGEWQGNKVLFTVELLIATDFYIFYGVRAYK